MADPLFQAIPTETHELRLVGELDMATVPVLVAALESQIAGERVTLDLSGLSFIDSSGLHALTRYAQTLNGSGPLVLTNVPDRFTTLFALVELDRLDTIAIR